MAAIDADISSSPVSLGPTLLTDPRIKEGLERPAVPADDDPLPSLQQVFQEVANDVGGLLNEYPRMSMALVDKSGNVLARTGLAPELFDDLPNTSGMDSALASEEPELFSTTLPPVGGKLHAVKFSRPLNDGSGRRLITIRGVDLEGGSFFRRVVGGNPSGLVRDGELIGDPIGKAKPEELVALATENIANLPPEGASKVFTVGTGGAARIGAGARVPGPAGKGKSGTLFIVLSEGTYASTQQDMATALRLSIDSGGLAQLNWLLVGGLLVISLGLTFYLPFIEYNGPLRRLGGEFLGIAEGRQHEIYHDTYGGELGRLARSTTVAMEALRVSWENELLDSDAELNDASAPPRRTRSTRSLRAAPKGRRNPSRAHKSLPSEEATELAAPSHEEDDHLPDGIDLPGTTDTSAPIERHAAADKPPRSAAPEPAPAPAFSDELSAPAVALGDNDDEVTLASVTDDVPDRESYYKQIYDEFVETKVACGEATDGFTYEKFAKKLRKQSDTLLARAEVKDVEFSVYVKDGKAALRAKVVKG